MKCLFAVLIAIIAVSGMAFMAFAQTPKLPDYQKDGEIRATYLCDGGKTTDKLYSHNNWVVEEIRAASGRVLLILDRTKVIAQSFFIKDTSSAGAKEYSFAEFGEIFAREAPMARADLLRQLSDCKKQ